MMKQQDLFKNLLSGNRKLQVKRNVILEEMLKPTCTLSDTEKIRLVAYLKSNAPKPQPVFEVLH